MTGADFRAHELADRLSAVGWTVGLSHENGEGYRRVTMTAGKPGREPATVTYRSVTADGRRQSTSLASAEVGARKLDGPRGLRAWLELATGNSGR